MEYSLLLSEKHALYGCLTSQHGLGYAGVARLLARFGSAEAVYGAGPEAWREAHALLSEAMAASLSLGPSLTVWERLVGQCEEQDITVTAPGWLHYPEVLTALEAPPPLLYLRGAWLPEDACAVALVGTRTPTAYGREAAFTLARDLAASGYTVVSGLALGIDAAAHSGALMPEGGRTIAVIGCGLDLDYPVENREVRARIEKRGAVISEHPPGTPAWPAHFPRRNRIISALSCATVVVEAGGKSGALLTAEHARAQKRLLFAVPGPIFSGVSSGTNALLREGAWLASSADDVIRALQGRSPESSSGLSVETAESSRQVDPQPRRGALTKNRRRPKAKGAMGATGVSNTPVDPELFPKTKDPVLELWGADEACPLDTLAARASQQGVWPRDRAAAALLESLLMLELRGLVRRLPGAVYRRTDGRR